MYLILFITVILVSIILYVNYQAYKQKKELEEFVSNRQRDNICSRPFISRGNNSYYSKLLNLDKRIDSMELNIMKDRKENLTKKIELLDKKYKWMHNYHSAITDPNSAARDQQTKAAKNKIRSDFKNSQKNAMNNFSNKYKTAFLDALRTGKSLPNVMPNIGSKMKKTLNKYKNSSTGNKAKERAKNKASKKIREGEDDLWEPIKSIVKLINDGKENKMNNDFKKNDNAPGIKGKYQFGDPDEGPDISNNKFSGAYA